MGLGIELRCSCATIPPGLVKVCYRCGRRDRIDGDRRVAEFYGED